MPSVATRNTLLVMAAAFLTCLPYLASLGFYNDDWVFFAEYGNATRTDLLSLIALPIEPTRPGSAAYHAVLYLLFGDRPLGYHLINAIVFAVTAGLCHAVLIRIGLSARDAFAVSIVWATLPHAATGRYWYSIFQMQASIALAFAAVLSELRSWHGYPWRWRSLALVLVIASGLFYEVALPLLALTAIISAKSRGLRLRALTLGDRLWCLAYPAVVSLLLLAKFLTTDRLDSGASAGFMPWFFSNLRSVVAPPSEAPVWGFNVWSALRVAFVDLAARLPSYAWESATSLGFGLETAVAAMLAAVTLVRLSGFEHRRFSVKTAAAYVLAGLCIFMLGWAVFLGSSQVQLSATGVGNRTAGAAAVGVAFVFVGVIQFVASMTPARLAPLLFAALTSVTVACGTLVILRIGVDWGTAYTRQQDALARIQARFPDGFAGRALMLDGVCQYVGPATIFEASWDLQWALQARYKDPSIRADVVTSSLEIREHAVRTTHYGEEKLYKYGSVVVYRPSSDVIDVLDNPEDARKYFDTWNIDRDSGCPAGRVGQGVEVFSRRPKVAYLSGFYPAERDTSGREWRWMDALGIVSLRNERREMLLAIQGQAPQQLLQSPTITISVNGKVLDTIVGNQPIDREYVIPESAQGDGVFSELRLRASETFVPALADPASVDRRRLGLVIHRLEWKPR